MSKQRGYGDGKCITHSIKETLYTVLQICRFTSQILAYSTQAYTAIYKIVHGCMLFWTEP